MSKNKENAELDFVNMISKSWTWAKLSKREQERFGEILEHPCSAVVIKGTYKQRYDACHALYYAYLEGLGYTPLDWREKSKED